MKTGKILKLERTTYLLELGVDFKANDLQTVCGGLKELSQEWTKRFNDTNYKLGKIVWIGFYDKETKTVKVNLEKELFV